MDHADVRLWVVVVVLVVAVVVVVVVLGIRLVLPESLTCLRKAGRS